MQHTPGPWTIEEYGDDDAPALVIHKDTESRVCFMATPGSHGDPSKIEADARLIVEAPTMYELLRQVDHTLGVHGKIDADTNLHQRVHEAIRRVIGNLDS